MNSMVAENNDDASANKINVAETKIEQNIEEVDISKLIQEVVMNEREVQIVHNLTQQLEAVQHDQAPPAVMETEETVMEATVDVETSGHYLVTATFDELKEVIEEYSEQTSSVFVVSRRTKDFGSPAVECDLSKHSIMWEEIDGTSLFRHELMRFDGIPFMVIGCYILHCQFGCDQSVSKKARLKKMKETGELVVTHSRKLSMPTKKCGCPASITAKQIIKFPDYYLEQRTEYRKKSLNKKLKDDLKANRENVKIDVYFVVKFPDVSNHKYHELLGDALYCKEPVLKELKFMIQDMTLEFKGATEIMNAVYSHVEDNLFYNKEPPERNRRKYFPRNNDVRNFSHRIREHCRFAFTDEEAMDELVKRLEEHQYNVCFRLEEPSMEEVLILSKSPETEQKKKKLQKMICMAFIFCFQTPSQARLLKKYGNAVYIVEVTHNSSATRVLTFRTYLLLVRTNVDFQIVSCFMLSKQKLYGFSDCLSTLKGWNSGWMPKYFIVDLNEQIIQAITNIFPESDYYFNTEDCEKKWLEFLRLPSNELVTCVDDVISHLKEVQQSSTQDTLQQAASNMEKSEAWISSNKLREWFQTEWLANAKRWVMEYRPVDLLMFNNATESMTGCIKLVQSLISDTTKSSGQTAFIEMIKNYTMNVSQEQYDSYVKKNKELYQECVQHSHNFPMADVNYGIPLPLMPDLHNFKTELKRNSYNIEAHEGFGIFKVSEIQLVDGIETVQQEVLVGFGDSTTYPSCTCLSWFHTRRPCVHMFAIFQALPQWKYDSLSSIYRVSNCLSIDYSCLDSSCIVDISKIEKSCQTDKIQDQDASTQFCDADSGNIFLSSENVPTVTKTFLTNLKEFSTQLEQMESIFSDKDFHSTLHARLNKLLQGLEKRFQWSQNKSTSLTDSITSTSVPKTYVSMKSFFSNKTSISMSGRPTASQTKANVTKPVSVSIKSGICKSPIVSKIVSNEIDSNCPKSMNLKLTPIKATDSKTNGSVEKAPQDNNYRSKLRSDKSSSTKTPKKTHNEKDGIIASNNKATIKRKLDIPVDVANAVNILTNSSIKAKKVKPPYKEES